MMFGTSTSGRQRSAAAPTTNQYRARAVIVASAFVMAASFHSSLQAQSSSTPAKYLSLEELMDIDVYSASRRLEPAQTVPSAIFVLTGEEIRRARVTSIPDALRLVPGMQVGRVDANKWAVSIRGFNSREANKILVLVDGRSIYDPLFSGTLWESQDVMLEDVDRIEVVRGPGGTLWGANAFNGVINIVTKHARDTQGGLVSAMTGTEERFTGAARYGWQTDNGGYARAYAKSVDRDTGFSRNAPPYDQSKMKRAGFRWDLAKNNRDEFRLSGDVYDTDSGVRDLAAPTVLVADVQNVRHRGANVNAAWTRRLSATDSIRFQLYYDHVGYDSITFDQARDAYDAEFQHTTQIAPRHLLIWGAGYRRMRDDTNVDFFGFITIQPARRNDAMSTVFLQDTITLVPERLQLTVGTKLENTDYASHEWQPNARLAWTPDPQQTWWTAASRAVRMPSRLEADLTFIGPIRPGDTMAPEHVKAYEAGYRRLVSAEFWYDISTFYNDYSDLRTSEAGGQIKNFLSGHAYGVELATRWTPTRSWRLDTAYTYFKMNLGLEAGSTGATTQPTVNEGLDARQQIVLRSAYDVAQNFELDTTVRFVDKLRTLGYPSYTTLDLGLSWHPKPGLELSLVGQNLLDSHHPEQSFVFNSSGIPTEVERAVYLKLTKRF